MQPAAAHIAGRSTRIWGQLTSFAIWYARCDLIYFNNNLGLLCPNLTRIFLKSSLKTKFTIFSILLLSVYFVCRKVLGSFSDEATSISVYKRLWLPLEQAAALAADAASPSAIKSNGVRKDGGVAVVLEDFLEAFLAEQALPEAACTSANATSKYSAMPTYVGGQLYAQFRAWFENALNDATIVADEPTSAQAIDRTLLAAGSTSRDGSAATLRINENDAIVESHLQKLFDFAHIYFASLGGEQGSKVVRLEAQSQRPQELAQLENQQPLKPSDQPLLSRFRGIRGQNVMDPPRPKQKRASAEVPSSQKGYGDPKLTSV